MRRAGWKAETAALLRRGALGLMLAFAAAPAVAANAYCEWPQWSQFRERYISPDGRVIDRSDARQITVSEGQAYALFNALVANDRASFERLLRWTEDNLAAGDLATRLPAWIWGRREDGSWGVIDSNPASDADLWIAYALAQAGRLWNERRYRVLATLVGRNLLQRETAVLPGLGRTLLPAPMGFALDGGRWRLNPSYAPPQLLRALARLQPAAGWELLLPSNHRLLMDSAPQGYAPNWALYDGRRGFLPDPQTAADGSYDAIRVYLWVGMLDAEDPQRAELLARLRPMAQATAAAETPPEHVDTRSGAVKGRGYAGFSAALLPFLAASGETATLERERSRVLAANAAQRDDAYYENMLTLFGLGWDQGWYRFGAEGQLQPRWQTPACAR